MLKSLLRAAHSWRFHFLGYFSNSIQYKPRFWKYFQDKFKTCSTFGIAKKYYCYFSIVDCLNSLKILIGILFPLLQNFYYLNSQWASLVPYLTNVKTVKFEQHILKDKIWTVEHKNKSVNNHRGGYFEVFTLWQHGHVATWGNK